MRTTCGRPIAGRSSGLLAGANIISGAGFSASAACRLQPGYGSPATLIIVPPAGSCSIASSLMSGLISLGLPSPGALLHSTTLVCPACSVPSMSFDILTDWLNQAQFLTPQANHTHTKRTSPTGTNLPGQSGVNQPPSPPSLQ